MSWNKEDKQGFADCSSKQIGQINLGSKLGNLIYELVSNEKFNIIYDIGCWNGEGSTKCIANAIDKLPSSQLFGFEVNRDKYNHTKELYKNQQNVHIIHGTPRLTKVTFDDIIKVFPNIQHSELEKYWCGIDLENLADTKDFEPHSEIDLIVHDGGEWDSWFIYQDLKSYKVKHWILDDTNSDKNKLVFADLKANSLYELVAHEPTDRNGWAHFKLIQ
jgi:hypothetical protein